MLKLRKPYLLHVLWSVRILFEQTSYFDVLLTLHLNIFILVINELDAQNFLFYNKFISCLYVFRAHVLIIRRSKLHYSASGIIILKQVSGLKLLNTIL